MASEESTNNDAAEVSNEQKDEKTEDNEATTSEPKEDSNDTQTTGKDSNEDEKEVKLYVGNLPDRCRRASLQELFEKYGKVSQCDIVKNFAFVVSLNLRINKYLHVTSDYICISGIDNGKLATLMLVVQNCIIPSPLFSL